MLRGGRVAIAVRVVDRGPSPSTVSKRAIDSDIPTGSRHCRVVSMVKARSIITKNIDELTSLTPLDIQLQGFQVPQGEL